MGVSTFVFLLSSSYLLPTLFRNNFNYSPTRLIRYPLRTTIQTKTVRSRPLVVVSCHGEIENVLSSSSNTSKKSILAKFIQEIEPLEVSLIQKDVSQVTIDAMKRTVSGMLGILPSDQFQVSIEALWEPLSNLLVSSMVTGYALRNAEYKLCLESKFDIFDGSCEKRQPENAELDAHGMLLDTNSIMDESPGQSEPVSKFEKRDNLPSTNRCIGDLGEINPEAQQYVFDLQSQLSSMKKELRELRRKNAALHMQQFVGEEKNDLLDYLRSLQPEKVAQLSEPTSLELEETIHSVVHGLLATLSSKMHSTALQISENTESATVNIDRDAFSELDETASLQFQPLVSVTRDYLARLLFWCLLLGHYLRGLEYRLELMELLTL